MRPKSGKPFNLSGTPIDNTPRVEHPLAARGADIESEQVRVPEGYEAIGYNDGCYRKPRRAGCP